MQFVPIILALFPFQNSPYYSKRNSRIMCLSLLPALNLQGQRNQQYTTTLVTITQLEIHQVHSTSHFEFARSTQSAVVFVQSAQLLFVGTICGCYIHMMMLLIRQLGLSFTIFMNSSMHGDVFCGYICCMVKCSYMYLM